jgi:hypothetical protein
MTEDKDNLIFTEEGPCYLCHDTHTVDVTPKGGQANDAREDECPWCLRRELNKLNDLALEHFHE